jgi:hypothetical protein
VEDRADAQPQRRGVQFAYRQLGPSMGVPVVFITHLAAVLENWDPRVVDGNGQRAPVHDPSSLPGAQRSACVSD